MKLKENADKIICEEIERHKYFLEKYTDELKNKDKNLNERLKGDIGLEIEFISQFENELTIMNQIAYVDRYIKDINEISIKMKKIYTSLFNIEISKEKLKIEYKDAVFIGTLEECMKFCKDNKLQGSNGYPIKEIVKYNQENKVHIQYVCNGEIMYCVE